MEPYYKMGLIVTTYNFFTSPKLVEALLKKATEVGTVCCNCHEIADELRFDKSKPSDASKVAFLE